MYKFLTKKVLSCGILLMGLAGFNSCIENDIPYPQIHANFLRFEVVGQLEEATINTSTREVSVKLADTVDIKNVQIKSYQITDSAAISPKLGDRIDLSSPQKFILRIYQDYEWTVKATQETERIFKVEGQVGQAEFDVDNHIAVIRIPEDSPVDKVRITELKLGPSNAVTTPDFRTVTNFTSPNKFKVKYRDITEEWTVYVSQTSSLATTVSANGWVTSAWLEGVGQAGADNGFEYRQANSDIWSRVPTDQISFDDGSFKAKVAGLSPQTDYVCRAYSGSDFGEELSFTTEVAVVLNNGSFDNWWKNGKIWNPWAENTNSFWDTGNKGATTLGESNTYPTDETANGSGKAAKLETRFVGVAGIGKLAAGNMFAGEYVRTDGTNGVLNFGRPFTSFPTKLRVQYKYTSKPINYTDNDHKSMAGKPDTCSIYIALGDWTTPLEIRTKPTDRQLFNVNDPNIIAYASFTSAETTTAYQQLELALDYRATNRKPTYIMVVCSASKYGDFFTGGAGSTLWIDNFELLYE